MILHQISNSQGNYHYNGIVYHHTAWRPHFHGSFELMYVTEGTVSISVNGVADTLSPGELILISPYTVHSLRLDQGQVWVGVFSEDHVASFAQKHKYTQYGKFRCPEDIETALKTQLFFQGTPPRFLRIACLYLVCHWCLENAKPHYSGQNNQFLYDVITYVAQNIEKNITLGDIAREMNYEYHYFSTLFNQSFSVNFKSFLNLLRIEQACALLSDSKYTVTQVSEACGFASIRNFNRVFQKVCSCAPLEYRKVHCNRRGLS